MKLIQEIIIRKPIEYSCKLSGARYTEVFKWASPVNCVKGDGKVGLISSACDIRGCKVNRMSYY